MAKHKKYTPKHRVDPAVVSARRAPKRLLRTGALLTGLAAAATGVSVTGGVIAGDGSQSSTAAVAANRINLAAEEVEREPVISRSDTRGSTDAAKAAELGQASGKGMSAIADMSGEDPREIAKALLTEFGFGQDQFGCLDSLYNSESHWRVDADNPNSSAYGIPQALPGSKMASAGADWATNPVTQIRWGLGYIQGRYGTPCGAWSFKRGHGWY
ncbi:MAG: lytic transglycosylase domain-containing protein [Nocardioides sp.]